MTDAFMVPMILFGNLGQKAGLCWFPETPVLIKTLENSIKC